MSRSTTGKLDINPTHTFFLQYTAAHSAKPGQSMQNLNKVSRVGEIIAKEDGTVSDSATSQTEQTGAKKRRPSMAKALVILGLSKKSSSANNLALGKRLVFPRSEEVGMTPELRNRFTQRGERDPSADTEDKKNDGSDQPKPRYLYVFSQLLKI